MSKLNLAKEDKYLLACSFGPDSMALFHLLVKNKYKFACAIVNYHLRRESDLEVSELLKYAKENNVEVYVLDVKEKITKNIEATCREIRYKFFADLCLKHGYVATLVAQHQDDLIETYLMQKERQNDPIYYGISEKTVIFGATIIRPLLNYKKVELEEICEKNNVPFMIDKTNFDISLMRNKIRHNVINKLLAKDREVILKEIDEKNKKLAELLASLDITRLSDIKYILSLDYKAQCYALNMMVKEIDNSLSLSKKNVGQILNVLKSNKPNGQFAIFKNLYLFKEYDCFEFGLSKVTQQEYKYTLICPGLLDTPFFYLDFKIDSSNRNVSFDDYPLTIRNLKKNDTIIINGYKVTAQRLMIDWKVPFRKRMIWPVIVNKNGECIYIPRYQKDFKVTESINFYVK